MSEVPENNMKSIILLTDGQDSEGYSILERKFTLIKKSPQIQFNTFGFSNDLWSDLLEKLALRGGGIFGFIPDQSMIGTIFINFIANTFQLLAQGVEIQIDDNYFDYFNRNELTQIAIKHGETRSFLLKKKKPLQPGLTIKIGLDENNMIDVELKSARSENTFEQLARYKMLELVAKNQLAPQELKVYEKYFEKIFMPSFLKEINQQGESDMNNEQVKLSYEHWNTWGAHYIRSFRFAHLHEQCLNFKSPSMSNPFEEFHF